MNNPFLRYRYGGVVSPQQSSGLGSLFPVQRLRGGGGVGGTGGGAGGGVGGGGGSAQSGGREGSESPSGRGFGGGGGGGGGVGSDPLGRAEHISRIGASIAASRSPSPSPNPLTRQAIQTRNRQALARARAKEREAFAPINDKKRADSIIEGLMSNLANKTMAKFDEAARVSELANATVKAAQEKTAEAALTRSLTAAPTVAAALTRSLTAAPTVAAAPKSMYSDLVTNMLSAPTAPAVAATPKSMYSDLVTNMLSAPTEQAKAANAYVGLPEILAFNQQLNELPDNTNTLTRLASFLPMPLGLIATAYNTWADIDKFAKTEKLAQQFENTPYADTAQRLSDAKKSGLLGAISRLGFAPSTFEGKGGLGEGTISSGPRPQVDLLSKPPGGGLATLPQSPSNVPPSANNLQQVPIPGAPGFSVTIGNPLVPTIFPLS